MNGALPELRLSGPMPWLIAVMVFLSVLAAAAGLGFGGAAASVARAAAGRATVQLVEADPALRESRAAAAVAALSAVPGVTAAVRVPQAEVEALVAPWLGPDAADLPLPALIDVDHAAAATPALAAAVARLGPAARIDGHADWLGPVDRLVATLAGLSAALVLLIAGATAATVVLAARGALDTHRATIEVLHLLGATDGQIATLFQRRFAIDAMAGGLAGFLAGLLVLTALGRLIGAVGSDLLGADRPQAWLFGWLLLVPVALALVTTVAARLTVTRALGRLL